MTRRRRQVLSLRNMEPALRAVYEQLFESERGVRASIFREYPSFVATWIPDRAGKTLPTRVVHNWWREARVFAFRHHGHFYFPMFQISHGYPKPVVQEVLALVQPEDGWHAMFWFVGANGWLGGRSPVECLGTNPQAVVDAASHANDEISD